MGVKLVEKIVLPTGTEAEVTGTRVRVKKGAKENARHFRSDAVELASADGLIEVRAKSGRRSALAEAKAIASHIRNMVMGLDRDYTYTLEIVYSHFPMTISVKEGFVEVSNLAGAKHPRRAKIMGDTRVVVKGKDISVSGHDKEAVGQTAANIEQATKVKRKDVRIFQDRIYITGKAV